MHQWLIKYHSICLHPPPKKSLFRLLNLQPSKASYIVSDADAGEAHLQSASEAARACWWIHELLYSARLPERGTGGRRTRERETERD